jgi:hypothetical protein
MTIWQLPEPSAERPRGLKYSLFFGREGRRIVGHDKERGKGDHKHLDEQEVAWCFVSVEQLVADFLAEVAEKVAALTERYEPQREAA